MNLQQVANQLSDELRRSVKVVGLDDRELATSTRRGLTDLERLAVPIRGTAGTIASFWLEGGERPPLSATDYELIDAAAGRARNLLGEDPGPGTGDRRESAFRRLLDDDPAVRHSALVDAVAHRWIERGSTIVYALKFDDSTDSYQRVSFGQHFAAIREHRAEFLRERDAVVYLATRGTSGEDVFDGFIRIESARMGIEVLAAGSARVEPSADDLAEAADRARTAMDLVFALPDLQPSQDFSRLGGWILLHSVPAQRRLLASVSPAAEQLFGSGDPLQRETIETYLDAGGQTRAACELLHIHRTTLYYRLENMPTVVREALNDGMTRSTLHLALKLVRLWERTGIL